MAIEERSTSAGGVLTMRSIYAGALSTADSGSQIGSTSSRGVNPQDARRGDVAQRIDERGVSWGDSPGDDDEQSDDDDAPDPVQLPHSTHSLLFTEPVRSLPFLFALVIMALSFACLFLALFNGLASGSIPVAVTLAVTAVQFLTILVVLLMEEEIPTGLWLLRMIPMETLRQHQSKFYRMKYRKFILSSILRILNGYCFLINATFVIVRATGVLEIFYDVLALQFVQQLDDMAFVLAQKDVLGKAMKRACTAKCFRAEFHKIRTRRTRSISIILKTIYFVNLCVMLGVMGVVSYRQRGGHFQHESITVDFGDTAWERAWVKIPDWLPPNATELPPGKQEEWILLYAFFNGVYEKDLDEPLIDGRPVYKERKKINTIHVSNEVNRTHFTSVVPAEIKYCSAIGAWVFTHPLISKSKSSKKADQGCNWLLRSPDTDEFDLLNVEGDWQVWVGVIEKADVSIVTNRCSDNSDCNLNGNCTDQKCVCESGDEDGVQYFGSHCEVALRDECRTILGEKYNETFTVEYSKDFWEDYTGDTILQSYNRPWYSYVEGSPEVDGILIWVKDQMKQHYNETIDFQFFLLYSGNRWFGIIKPTWDFFKDEWKENFGASISEYHAFWSRANTEAYISDPTTRSTPVGVDFYLTGHATGEIGEQFGPFGALYPIQLYNQTGRGYFRCDDSESNLRNVATADRRLQFPMVRAYKRA